MAAVDESWGSVMQKVVSSFSDKPFEADISALRNDEERIRACFSNSLITNKIDSWIDGFGNDGRKSLENADLARLDGNKHFQRKRYSEASESYSQAIRYCPVECQTDGDSKLSIAYANRSAALFHLSKYELCLRDIDLAISCGYPSRLLYKVYTRKAHCLSKLLKDSDCADAAKIALELIEDEKTLTDQRKESLKNEISVGLLSRCSDDETRSSHQQNGSENQNAIPDLSYGQHENLSSVSASLDIRYNEEKGRYIVTNRTVSCGDVLFVEKPFASVLLPEFYHVHCHHCHALMDAPLPCGFCCDASYCSAACASAAYDSYHRVECRFLKLLHATGLGHLAIRIVLKAGISYLLENEDKLRGLENDFSINATPFLRNDDDDYLAVYSLVSHKNDIKLEDRFAYVLSAVMLSKLLDEELEKCRASGDQKCYVGSILLRHIHQLICNAFTITKLDCTVEESDIVETESQVRIAPAIYPVASLMNHSCDPSIISSFHKDVLIVRAVKNLAETNEVFNCYGPHYLRMSKAQRQTCLKQQYFFQCKCDKCSTDNEIEATYDAFCCRSCQGMILDGVCVDCKRQDSCKKHNLKYSRSLQLYEKAEGYFEKQDFRHAFEQLEHCLRLQRKVLFRYHKHLGRTYDMSARCAVSLGNSDKATELLKTSIEIVEKIYGLDSIELANELQKLTDVQINKIVTRLGQSIRNRPASEEYFDELRKPVSDVMVNVNRALNIFERHYGPIHKATEEMSEKRSFLTEISATVAAKS